MITRRPRGRHARRCFRRSRNSWPRRRRRTCTTTRPVRTSQACKDGQSPVAPVDVLDAFEPTALSGARGMKTFQELDLRFLVDANHAGAPRRPQIPPHHPSDLAAKVRIGAVQPPLDSVRLYRGGLQPSPDRAFAERPPHVPPGRSRLRQRAQDPMGPSRRQLGLGVAGETNDVMPLFRGKTSVGDPNAARRPARPVDDGQIARASAAPICDRGPHAGRSPRRSAPGLPAEWPGLAQRSTARYVPFAVGGRVNCAPAASAVLFDAPSTSSWPAGYLTALSPWGRTFGTRY